MKTFLCSKLGKLNTQNILVYFLEEILFSKPTTAKIPNEFGLLLFGERMLLFT